MKLMNEKLYNEMLRVQHLVNTQTPKDEFDEYIDSLFDNEIMKKISYYDVRNPKPEKTELLGFKFITMLDNTNVFLDTQRGALEAEEPYDHYKMKIEPSACKIITDIVEEKLTGGKQ